MEKFPCLALAYDALRQGGTMPAVLNAANEIAVQAFLDGKIRLSEIAEINKSVMNRPSKHRSERFGNNSGSRPMAREHATEFLRGKEAGH